MDGEKIISVLVPVYNPGERLRDCLDSLLAQSQKNLEVLLLDDGSTDGSLEVERDYAQRHGELFRLVDGEHGGVSCALNRGIEAARGEWIGFCDSDDVAEPQLYEVLHDNALRYDADLSCCGLREISDRGERILTTFPVKGEVLLDKHADIMRRIFQELMLGTRICYGYQVICLFKRSLLLEHGIRFPVGIPMREDEMFLLRYLLIARRVVGTDRALYRYVREGGSLCQTFYGRWNAYEREQIWVKVFQEQRNILADERLDENVKWLREVLTRRVYLHQAQLICCTPALGFCERSRRLRKLAEQARKEGAVTGGRGTVFWLALMHMRWLLPTLCWGKRCQEAIARNRWKVKAWFRRKP